MIILQWVEGPNFPEDTVAELPSGYVLRIASRPPPSRDFILLLEKPSTSIALILAKGPLIHQCKNVAQILVDAFGGEAKIAEMNKLAGGLREIIERLTKPALDFKCSYCDRPFTKHNLPIECEHCGAIYCESCEDDDHDCVRACECD